MARSDETIGGTIGARHTSGVRVRAGFSEGCWGWFGRHRVVLVGAGAFGRSGEARFALLIGNQSYDPSVGLLKNPHNDIAVVGEALAKQGFELLPLVRCERSN